MVFAFFVVENLSGEKIPDRLPPNKLPVPSAA
jgi:hypothetical protein